MFAAVDGGGKLDLWNLNVDVEVPVASTIVNSAVPVALNQISWNKSGHAVAAGDDCGKIWLYDIDKDFADPAQDEWGQFAETIAELHEKTLIKRENKEY